MSYYLGIDLGGTAIKIGITDNNGNIICKDQYETNIHTDPDKLVAYFGDCALKLIKKSNIDKNDIPSAGIGAPGLLNPETGQLYDVTNLRQLDGYYLAKVLSKHINMPVYMDNDVNAMALAELYYGAAKGCKNVVAITLGTGVGGGIIINGELYRGTSFTAGELGHMSIESNGLACNCGGYGCIECYASRDGIVQRFNGYYKYKEIPSSIKKYLDNGNITPKAIADAANAGDKLALRVWEEVGSVLGIMFGGIVNILNPEIIVIGGGISQAGELILKPAREEMIRRAYPVPAKAVRIVQAKLLNDAGLIGAASIALSQTNS